MEWKVQLSELNYDDSERQAVDRVLAGEWLTMGAKCIEFESSFADYHRFNSQGVFVSSATAALHLILMSLKIGINDEVIIPALTFVSDANVIKQLGATPVFADSQSLQDFNVSSDDIISKISDKTKAIVIVHFAGFPMDLSRLKKICKQKNISLIEDCAHAPGASIDQEYCGTFGDFSFYSFFSNKNLAVGEGGMVFARDPVKLDCIRLMRSHGMSSVTIDRHLGRNSTYDVSTVGLNYRADEMRAALGLVQLKKLSAGNAKRRELFNNYIEKLADTEILVPFKNVDSGVLPACHIMPILLPISCNRSEVMAIMKSSGIQTSIHYPSFLSFTAYKEEIEANQIKVANEISERELTLPMHPRLKFDEVSLVVETLLRAVQ